MQTFGSKELADSVLSMLPGKNAVLMKNHGSMTVASTLKKALARSVTLEWCCEVWLKAATAGEPSILTDDPVIPSQGSNEKYCQTQKTEPLVS